MAERLILDSHSLLWYLENNVRLSARAKALIDYPPNHRYFSMASIWEIAIKVQLGKLPLLRPFHELFPGQLNRNGIGILDLTVEHTIQITLLPLHHRDPFDRILIAQAIVEDLKIISADPLFDQYGVERIW